MQLTCILHKYMFSDVIPCGTTLKLHICIDLTYHALLGHEGLPVIHEGLPVMWELVCHVPQLQL